MYVRRSTTFTRRGTHRADLPLVISSSIKYLIAMLRRNRNDYIFNARN